MDLAWTTVGAVIEDKPGGVMVNGELTALVSPEGFAMARQAQHWTERGADLMSRIFFGRGGNRADGRFFGSNSGGSLPLSKRLHPA